MNRIGPNMKAAVAYVASNPGCPKLPVAKHVGPHASTQYGYQSVDRAIRAGLIEARPTGRGYALTVTDAGAAIL